MGSDDLTQPGTRIDDALWREFRNDVEDRFGTVRGHLRHELENALREYLRGTEGGDTHDRLRRLENAVGRIDERTAALASGEAGKNKKDSDVSPTTKNRLNEIEGIIEREAGTGTVHEAVVRQAIEDVAGHSDPTIRRYRQMLTDRQILYPHPKRSNSYVHGEREFVEMTQSLRKAGAIGQGTYEELVEGFGGVDPFRDALERHGWENDRDERKGFA